LGLAFGTLAQLSPHKSTFDIKWPDGSKTAIMFSDSIGSFYLMADSSIEFDAKPLQGGIYLKAESKKAECMMPLSFLVAGSRKLKLGNGQAPCYDFLNYGEKELVFRSSKENLTGKLNYVLMEFLYCKIWEGRTCLSYEGQSTISLSSYSLDTNRIEVPIDAIVLHTGQTSGHNEQVTVSPNPFSDHLFVRSNMSTAFHLLSLEGKTILSNLPTNQPIDMSELEDGFYIAQIGNSGVYKRIIKR